MKKRTKKYIPAVVADSPVNDAIESLRRVYAKSPLPTIIVDSTGTILDANIAMMELTGYESRYLDNDTNLFSWIDRLFPITANCKRAHNIVSKSLAGEIELKRDEFIITRRDGANINVEFSIHEIAMESDPRLYVIQGMDITDSKQTEEGLKLLTSAIEQSSEGVSLFDLGGSLLFVNNAFAAMHGYTPDDLVGKHISLFHTSEQFTAMEKLLEGIDTRGEYHGEIWHVQRDGTVFPTLNHTTLLRDTAGIPMGYISTCQDITVVKRQEIHRQTLRQIRNEVLRMTGVKDIMNLLQVIGENLALCGIAYQNVEVNVIENINAPIHIKSYRLTEPPKWSVTTHTEQLGIIMQYWESGTPVYRRDLSLEDPYGELEIIRETWGEIRSVIDIPFSHGTLALNSTKPNAFTHEDIRFLRELAQILSEGFQRAEMLEKLSLSEARYRTLIETPAGTLVMLIGRDREIQYISPQLDNLTGRKADCLKTVSDMYRHLIHGEDADEMESVISGAFKGRTIHNREIRLLCGDGSLLWIESAAQPVIEGEGGIETIQLVMNDIGERKRAEDALRETEARNRAILNAIPDIILQIANDGTILNLKGNYHSFGGDNVIRPDTKLEDIFPDETAAEIKTKLKKTLSSSSIQVFEYRYTVNNDPRYFESRMVRCMENDVLVIIRDITVSKRLESRRLALQLLRREVVDMNSVDDIASILRVLDECLKSSDIAYANGCINIIENFETPVIKAYSIGNPDDCLMTVPESGRSVIMGIWSAGEPAYRRDIQANDTFNETGHISKYWGDIRSVLDIPFSHGTLALNSLLPDAFRKEDIAFLQDICQILSEGFRRAEDLQQLALSEARYRTLVEAPVDQVVMLADTKGNCLYISPQIQTLTGYSPEEFYAHTAMYAQVIHSEYQDEWKQAFSRIVEEGSIGKQELSYHHRNGDVTWVTETSVPLMGKTGEVEAVQIVIHNITDRKRAEVALRKSEEQYQNLYDFSPDIYFTVSPKGKIVSVNQFGAEYLGYRKKDLLGKDIWDIAPSEDCTPVRKRMKAIIQRLQPDTELECRMVRKDGSIIWVHERTNLIIGEDGRLKELRLTCRDITDSKHTREQLGKSLEEKEILLKEIHHRVKNNMQVISSLLSLQADRISDSYYISMFNESINRIQTMALIHELLYKSDNFTYIDFREYITRITGYLSNLYTSHDGVADVIIDADTIHLELDTAIPCGLVINELVSNAFKYGLTDRRGGTIKLAMKVNKDRWFELTVADDGPGMPEGFDWRTADTLGLKMVNLLVNHQIGGTIERIEGEGTVFRIRFKR